MLLDNLENSRKAYQDGLFSDSSVASNEQSEKAFKESCIQAMNTAKPHLENDLEWGTYLNNLLKVLLNAAIKVVSAGQYTNNFFNYTPAESFTELSNHPGLTALVA